MNNGVKRGAKVWIAKIIEMIFLIFMALFAAIPLLQVLLNSFRTDREVKTMPLGLPKEWVFNNFPETWEIGGYATAYFNSLLTAAVVIVVVLTVVGFGAYATSKLQFKLRGFFVAYFFVANSLPGFLYIVPDYFMMNKIGLVDTRWSLMIVYTAINIPFNMLLLTTGLNNIPGDVYEAASIDGATSVQKFFKITIPLLKPTIMSVLILGFVLTFKVFDLVYVMTGGGPVDATEVLSTYSYKLSFQTFHFGEGAAAANVLFICLFIVALIYLKTISKDETI